jgi:carotenoid cleavage dioxygenase-like enzyme
MNAPVLITPKTNPYLSGNFGPIASEDAFELQIDGAFPKALAGALYRIGPNPQFSPRDDNYHWFVGDGMVPNGKRSTLRGGRCLAVGGTQ